MSGAVFTRIFSFMLLLSACGFLYAQPAPPPRVVKDKAGKPNWAANPAAAFARDFYLAATGIGSSREEADAAAFAQLTGLFGQSVKSNISTVEQYREQLAGGKIKIAATQDALQAVEISASLDSLIGAEIFDRWEDAKQHIFYAVAVMEKPRAVTIYGALYDANLALIKKTLALSAPEKQSFTGLSQLRIAGRLADANEVFARILTTLGAGGRVQDMKPGDELRYETQLAARQIPVYVEITGDADGRFAAAFAKSFSNAGFRTGTARGRYALRASFHAGPAVRSESGNFFTRFTVDARLVDTQDGSVILPWSITDRSGQLSQTEAENRALFDAEKAIEKEFTAHLKSFLSGE